ncbi:hypothetical protein [Flavobacterium sp. H122]|uniref:hypothetical protein n=1 Tax=Flavobacterium sp. H122 TaxID=2529860 RepID=UPI0010AA53AD|nr:hypothetical protein [Flavobacterium sp. H122]
MKLTYSTENQRNNYHSNSKRAFSGFPLSSTDVKKTFDFAFEMCMGTGHHRAHRTGGQYDRSNGEKFCNTFQGKLAEIVLYNHFKSHGFDIKEPDFGVYGKGLWDDSDLEINGKKINVKSAAFFSNLQLLETRDWNTNGQYIPNLNTGTTSKYDYFVLVRIKPDLKSIFRENNLFNGTIFEKDNIEATVTKQNFSADIAGYITHTDLITVIANRNILPQNSYLNGKVRMDAENYYIQCGDMRVITDLVSELKAMPQPQQAP